VPGTRFCSSFIHMRVNHLSPETCDTRIVSRPVHGAPNSPAAYRNVPGYGTLPSSRRAVRSNDSAGDRGVVISPGDRAAINSRGDRKAVHMKRILIIEDDRDIVELVRYNLANEGFQVVAAYDGGTGLSTLKKSPPDLLLLDLMLPKLSGLDICREIRKDESLNRLPVLMLTARGEEADRVVGLEMGADDYVVKPFSPRELIARVKALLRRAEPPTEAPRVIEVGSLAIDPASYRVSQAGKHVPLSTLEFRLLYYLASRPNRVFTRDQLLDAVWGTDRFVTPRSVDVYVRRLREKIEADPENPVRLKTVRGAGYLFETRAA
jgi:phosphate regulon transcriptional regulator PhoB